MTSAFDEATAVRQEGPGRFCVIVDPQWSIGGRANGGYLLAILARAATAGLPGGLGPLAVTGAFAAAAPAGPATVEVETVRQGRSTAVVRARLVARDEVCLDALVTAGLHTDGDPVLPGPPPPALPPREACVRLPETAPGFAVPLMGPVDQRLDPMSLRWAMGSPSGDGELRGYVSFEDGRPMDALGLVLAVDCMPPATFDVPGLKMGWVPTLQLSAFVRAVPAPGPVVVRHLARSVGSGAVDETTDVWDSTGRLVAVGHQLALVRPA